MRTLLIALFLSGSALADTSADKKKDPPKDSGGKAKAGDKDASGKAKTGDACKTDSDCYQEDRPQRCRDSKCQPMPTHPVT